ncbi:MAG: type II toxin-antitoxin system VapC family toxin [Acidobacteria bacterium]|nr:type II toxin-antitoxin system VapC family toxin [Acidobacteriota bacterium]
MTNGSVVFDSWALLAWLLDQPSAPTVRRMLLEAEASHRTIHMSWVNAGEVYYMAARKLSIVRADEFWRRLPTLPIQLVLPSERDVIAAARLKASRRISYADAFAADLAIRHNAALVTGDPELRLMTGVLRVEWLGPGG